VWDGGLAAVGDKRFPRRGHGRGALRPARDLLAEISNTIHGSRVEWLSQPGHPQTRCTVTGRSRTPSRRHQQDADPGWPVPSRSSACRHREVQRLQFFLSEST